MGGVPVDDSWIAALPTELDRQRGALTALVSHCAATPPVASFSVGCSLGRGAADALSDIDAAVGVDAPGGAAGAARVREVEEGVVALLPGLGEVVDVWRQEDLDGAFCLRRVFAQLADGLQLDLAVVAEQEVRRGEAAPDFVPLYWRGERPAATQGRPAREVSPDQVRDWAFHGWRAVLDADKYLHRGSLWEAHHRLHELRQDIWRLWASAHGASYPWHGLSQVLDDLEGLPPGVEGTVAGLDAGGLRRALLCGMDVLDEVARAAAGRCGGDPGTAMAAHARRVVAS